MEVSQRGIELIKQFEGFSPRVYKDSAGYPTIGYGHLVRPHEQFTEPMTEKQAERLLLHDLRPVVRALNTLVHVPLKQHQFDALASFVYNVGIAAFERSTLLKKLNQGRYEEAADELLRWVWITVNGKKYRSKGLMKRRLREREIFLEGYEDERALAA